MNAYLAEKRDEFGAVVIFAETAGKARAAALRTSCFEDENFIGIRVTRLKEADKFYKPGKTEMDWNNLEDRIALVKDLNFYCDYGLNEIDKCKACQVNKFCENFKNLKEMEHNASYIF